MFARKCLIGIVFVVVAGLLTIFLLWSNRKIPETVVIIKPTQILPETTDSEEKSSIHQSDALSDNTSLTYEEPDNISEEHGDDLSAETEDLDVWEFFDDFSGVSGEMQVNEELETDDELINSPFGFGNFPDIPSDFPRQDVWEFFWELYDVDEQAAEKYELINRVIIQLWKEGGRAPGGVLKYGKVYPLDNNTAYITWDVAEGPNGEVKRYIRNLTTTPDIAGRYVESHFRNGLIPSGVNVIEHSSGGYNPYDFIDQ